MSRGRIRPNQTDPKAAQLIESRRNRDMEPESLTAHLMGDPLPGRSALDQRLQAHGTPAAAAAAHVSTRRAVQPMTER